MRVWIAALLLATPAFAHEYRFADVVFERAYDGDTITVTLQGIHPLWGDMAGVRVNGIDTPEIRGQCDAERELAVEARDRVGEMLWHAHRVSLERCSREKYGRLLCDVTADGVDLAGVLVAEGLARPYDGGRRESWCEPE